MTLPPSLARRVPGAASGRGGAARPRAVRAVRAVVRGGPAGKAREDLREGEQEEAKVYGPSAERLKLQEKAAEEEAKRAEEKKAKKAIWQQHEASRTRSSATAAKNGQPPPADLPEVEAHASARTAGASSRVTSPTATSRTARRRSRPNPRRRGGRRRPRGSK